MWRFESAKLRALVQSALVQDRLAALATRLEAIARRIRTLGLLRTAEDLSKVSAELRGLSDQGARVEHPS